MRLCWIGVGLQANFDEEYESRADSDDLNGYGYFTVRLYGTEAGSRQSAKQFGYSSS